MALKKPSQQASTARKPVSAEEAEALANKLADKPYGDEANSSQDSAAPEVMARTTISIPASLLIAVEDDARDNKRKGIEPKSVSAIIRDALTLYYSNK